MKINFRTIICTLAATGSICSTLHAKESNVDRTQKLLPIALENVTLTDGMFKHAMELDSKWLLSLEPDRFLSGFRSNAGLQPRAAKYGGWEDSGATGHAFGHYLSACAMLYASTGDKQISERLSYIVSQLDSCQQAIGTGFIAGFPRAVPLFEEVARGDIRSKGFDLNEGWVPMYTMHKLFAGLIDIYKYTGNEEAKKVLIKLSEWAYKTFNSLNDEQLAAILVSEHGGINESFADIYAITGDKRYMGLAGRLNHMAIMEPLIQHKDQLQGQHANTQVPKIIGAVRQYELGGDEKLYDLADFFWTTVVDHHTYVIGGNSEAEHFGAPSCLHNRLTASTCETCNTYNMLKLTKHLHQLAPSTKKLDYYERALYNHIFATQNAEDGMVSYMSPLASGTNRVYSLPYDSFWCCVGTGFENHVRYNEFIYSTDHSDNLYVNLFIPSELKFKSHNMTIKQTTRFPESDTVTLTVSSAQNAQFALNLRYPSWAKSGFSLAVNGKTISKVQRTTDGYVSIDRKWKNGDKITYVLPKTITSEEALGDSNLRAYLYGPIVLATVLGDNATIPCVVADDILDAPSIVVKTDGNLRFKTNSTKPNPIEFIPYYELGARKLAVYLQHYTPESWAKNQNK